MKQIFTVGILFVFFCSAWVLFLEYRNKHFIQNLPQIPHKAVSPPKTHQVLANPQGDEDSSASEESIELVAPRSVDDIKMSTDSASEGLESFNERDTVPSIDGEVADEFHPHLQVTESEVPQKPEGMSLAAWLQGLSHAEKEAVYTERPWLKPYTQMTPEELDAEVMRQKQQLIDRYGNTPEVAIINRYTTAASLLGEPRKHKGEEGLEYIRAVSVIWPTQMNIEQYERLRAMQENGWHVDPTE